MAGGKHASRSKSFDDFDTGRRRNSRRGKREKIEEEEVDLEDDRFNIHNDDEYENNSEFDKYDDDDDYEDEEANDFRKKMLIAGIIIVIIFAGIGFGAYKAIFSNKEPEEEVVEVEKMPLSIAGYKVLGQIKIDNLNVEQYILNLPEDDALKNGVVKLYGSSLNGLGNMCIAGHNKEGVFKDIGKLNVGNKIVIKDPNNNEFEFRVTSVKTVEPDDLECLLQDSKKIEITLITCSDDSTSRVIVKAEKVTKDNG